MQQQKSRAPSTQRPLRILTWHVHGSYLYYLTQVPHEFYLPVKKHRPEGYGGKAGTLPWGENVHEIPAKEAKDLEIDLILFQSKRNYLVDQYEILSPEQRQLPRLFLEHDPPREVPTDTRHAVTDPEVGIVHVTHFNEVMWDNGSSPTFVIPHGVLVPPGVSYQGTKDKGIAVINNIVKRGRRLGADIFAKVRQEIPLDIVGMGSEEVGGLGEIPHRDLASFMSQYRFFFNPIRYTSLGLSVCEAMMIGMPMVGLATTEMSTVIKNGYNGYAHTNIDWLIRKMEQLLLDPELAQRLSAGARTTAHELFPIDRFVSDWDTLFRHFHTLKHSAELLSPVKKPVFVSLHQRGGVSL